MRSFGVDICLSSGLKSCPFPVRSPRKSDSVASACNRSQTLRSLVTLQVTFPKLSCYVYSPFGRCASSAGLLT